MVDHSFAMLLCSRICHDLISPVGAVNNGLEILDDVTTPDMRDEALALIRTSAQSASGKLQFMRMAFGAGGTVTESVALDEAQELSEALVAESPITLDWQASNVTLERKVIKLLLNMIFVGFEAMPRGGTLGVGVRREGATNLMITAEGPQLRIQDEAINILCNGTELSAIDAKQANLLLTYELARSLDATLFANSVGERLELATTF